MYLIDMDSQTEATNLIRKICNIIKKKKYIELSTHIEKGVQIYTYKRESKPYWISKVYFKVSEVPNNTTNYRIVFYYIRELQLLYIESNGAISSILKDLNYKKVKYIHTSAKLENNTDIIKFVKQYLFKQVKKKFDKFCKDKKFPHSIFIPQNIDETLNAYNELEKNELEQKLPCYDSKKHIDKNGKQSEAEYNKYVCEQMQFKLLDKIAFIYNIEIGDMFDSKKQHIHHVKRIEGVRELCFQIINSAIILNSNNNDKVKTLKLNYGINDNVSYVVDIIKNSSQKLTIMRKTTLGATYMYLKLLGYNLYFHYIEHSTIH